MKSHDLAPVALFVYNRPEHTRQTVEALARNPEAASTRLYIFSDAPRTTEAEPVVAIVRNYLRSIKGFQHVEIVERESNYGLARSIIDGVTRLCEDYGRAVVLEDDLVTSPYFLRYMNDALDFYKESEGVMHISGSAYPVGPFEWPEDTYFLRVPLCWGWGTWQRAWNRFEKDLSVMEEFDTTMIRSFNFDQTYNYWQQLEFNQSGKMDTWFVFWYARVFLWKGLSLFPACSLVRNIGHDGSGVHCGASDLYEMELCNRPPKVRAIPLEESLGAFEAHKRYFKRIRPTIAARLFSRLRRMALATCT
jgi:hypothetical protein